VGPFEPSRFPILVGVYIIGKHTLDSLADGRQSLVAFHKAIFVLLLAVEPEKGDKLLKESTMNMKDVIRTPALYAC
jgi:hypothetical protein